MEKEGNTDIIEVSSEPQYQIAKQLFREYNVAIGIDLGFQNFDKELEDLADQYSRPKGVLLLAKNHSQFLGCVAIRKFEEGIAELKRMYVKPEARGLGLGQMLLEKAINEAKVLGYEKIVLDTLANMKPAIAVYKKNGFYEISSYRYNPFDEALYFEKKL